MLTEYYKVLNSIKYTVKFHRDIPRLYMVPISVTLAKYHDKRRKIEYIRITKMLNIPTEKEKDDTESLPNENGNLVH